MPILQQNFIIEKYGLSLYFVGANCVRPLHFTGISDEKPMILYIQNIYRNYGLTIIQAGEHSSPLHKKFHRICVFYSIIPPASLYLLMARPYARLGALDATATSTLLQPTSLSVDIFFLKNTHS